MTRSFNSKHFIFLVLFALLGMPGCRQPEPVPVKDLLFASLDCEQACWRNVVMGASEPFEIFLEWADQTRASAPVAWPASRFYGLVRGAVQESYQERNGVIVSVLVGGHPYLDVGLQDIVGKLGIAAYSEIIAETPSEIQAEFPDLLLYYPEHGYALRFDMNVTVGSPFTLENSCLWENYALDRFLILEAGDIQTMIMHGASVVASDLAPEEAREIIEGRLRPLHITLGCGEPE